MWTMTGVKEVHPKIAPKHVVIRYEPRKVGREQIAGALETAGFTAVEA